MAKPSEAMMECGSMVQALLAYARVHSLALYAVTDNRDRVEALLVASDAPTIQRGTKSRPRAEVPPPAKSDPTS